MKLKSCLNSKRIELKKGETKVSPFFCAINFREQPSGHYWFAK